MPLLCDHFSQAEWFGGRWQQVEIKFGDRQEQWFWWLDLGVSHRAGALLDDFAQRPGASNRLAGFNIDFGGCRMYRNAIAVTDLF